MFTFTNRKKYVLQINYCFAKRTVITSGKYCDIYNQLLHVDFNNVCIIELSALTLRCASKIQFTQFTRLCILLMLTVPIISHV